MTSLTQLQGTIGAATGTALGQSHAVRTNRSAAFLNAPISARFQEAVLRGSCFGVCNQTGITTQAGLSATTPALTLYNPPSSGKYGVLWYAAASFEVVFAAVASIYLAVNTNTAAAAIANGSAALTRNLLLGSSNSAVIQALLTCTLPAAPVAVDVLGVGLTGAVNLLPTGQVIGGWLDGSVVIAPNTAVSIQSRAASGASGTFCTFKWEEIDI